MRGGCKLFYAFGLTSGRAFHSDELLLHFGGLPCSCLFIFGHPSAVTSTRMVQDGDFTFADPTSSGVRHTHAALEE